MRYDVLCGPYVKSNTCLELITALPFAAITYVRMRVHKVDIGGACSKISYVQIDNIRKIYPYTNVNGT